MTGYALSSIRIGIISWIDGSEILSKGVGFVKKIAKPLSSFMLFFSYAQ
jgi:hypothetical protein